jgi:hypothetical protein
MRADHDRASSLHRDEDFVDRGRCRVRGGNDGGDDAEGLGDFNDAAIVVACDDADGLHRSDEVVDLLGAEQVLLDLVLDDPVAGFFDGKPRECFGVRGGRSSHGLDDGVNPFLAEF